MLKSSTGISSKLREPIRLAVRLQQLRGIGPVTATALLATVGDASQFANGRQMAASFGLTPKQNSSGSRARRYTIRVSSSRW
uniref:transposase n=1 Tax=Massilia litorea TaxID=2769491 RepID=UPI0027D9568C|nr:transposase [Massilia litorea]